MNVPHGENTELSGIWRFSHSAELKWTGSSSKGWNSDDGSWGAADGVVTHHGDGCRAGACMMGAGQVLAGQVHE